MRIIQFIFQKMGMIYSALDNTMCPWGISLLRTMLGIMAISLLISVLQMLASGVRVANPFKIPHYGGDKINKQQTDLRKSAENKIKNRDRG
jgi:hypothetical protein